MKNLYIDKGKLCASLWIDLCKTARQVGQRSKLLAFVMVVSVSSLHVWAQEPLVTIITTDDSEYEGSVAFTVTGSKEDFASLRIDAGYGKKPASEVNEDGEIPLKGNLIRIYGKIEGLVAPMDRTYNVAFSENDCIKQLSFALNELPEGIDLSANKALEYVSFMGCEVQTLDFSKLPVTLKTIYLTGNNLPGVDLSGLPNLETVYIDDNPLISSVDFKGNKNLQRINISGNPLIGSVDLSEQKNLTVFEAWDCGLTDIDFSHADGLESVSLRNNKLNNIKFGKTDNLQILDIANNNIKSLETDKMPEIQSLNVTANNEMEVLDVSKCEYLLWLNVDSTRISTLNLANCTGLEVLTAAMSPLKELDLSNNPSLAQLSIENCGTIAELDISGKPNLRMLIVAGNKLGQDATKKIAMDLPDLTLLPDEYGTWGAFLNNTLTEKNLVSKESVRIAKSKGWDVVARNGNDEFEDYEGVDTGLEKAMASPTKKLRVMCSDNCISIENLPQGYRKEVNLFDASGRKISSAVTDNTSISFRLQPVMKDFVIVECNGATAKGIIR